MFGFGDRLPSGPDDDLFVSYEFDGMPGGVLAGPYKTRDEANEELLDISTFSGVKNAKIVTKAELKGIDE
jgi:hypothetical protein